MALVTTTDRLDTSVFTDHQPPTQVACALLAPELSGMTIADVFGRQKSLGVASADSITDRAMRRPFPALALALASQSGESQRHRRPVPNNPVDPEIKEPVHWDNRVHQLYWLRCRSKKARSPLYSASISS